MMDAAVWIPAGLAGLGGVVWMVRLEGRVNTRADHSELATLRTKVEALEDSNKVHGETRDIVIALRSDMRALEKALTDFTGSVRDALAQITHPSTPRPRTKRQ